jgi:hypothetical protein
LHRGRLRLHRRQARIQLGTRAKIGALLKSIASKNRFNFSHMTDKEFQEMRTKKLTCLCVYNSNTNGHAAPNAPFNVDLVNTEVTLQSTAVHLRNTLGLNINEGENVDIEYGISEVWSLMYEE